MTKEIFIDQQERTAYLKNPIGLVIESVVTNNLGYSIYESRPFDQNSTAKLTFKDRKTVISDPDHINLQWHLMKMRDKKVLPFEDKSDQRFPILCKFEAIFIKLPPWWESPQTDIKNFSSLEPSQN